MKADKWFFASVLVILGTGYLILQSRVSKLEQAPGKVADAPVELNQFGLNSRGFPKPHLFNLRRDIMSNSGWGFKSMRILPNEVSMVFTNGPQERVDYYPVAL